MVEKKKREEKENKQERVLATKPVQNLKYLYLEKLGSMLPLVWFEQIIESTRLYVFSTTTCLDYSVTIM